MQNTPVLSIIAFSFIAIFTCAVYTLSQTPVKQAQASAETPVPRPTSISLSYVDGPQAEPPAWPAVLTP